VSSVWELFKKLKTLRRNAQKANIKPPYVCPKCFEKTMVVEKSKPEPLVRIWCGKCRLIEIMPNHDLFEKVDYYAVVVDYWLSLFHPDAYDYITKEEVRIPVFRFAWMYKRHLKALRKIVTFGEIKVDWVREELPPQQNQKS